MTAILHAHRCSTASHRVRIALSLTGIAWLAAREVALRLAAPEAVGPAA